MAFQTANACSCAPLQYEATFDEASAVVVATVTGLSFSEPEHLVSGGHARINVELKVLEALKGEVSGQVEAISHTYYNDESANVFVSDSCSEPHGLGETYVVFLGISEVPSIEMCSGTSIRYRHFLQYQKQLEGTDVRSISN